MYIILGCRVQNRYQSNIDVPVKADSVAAVFKYYQKNTDILLQICRQPLSQMLKGLFDVNYEKHLQKFHLNQMIAINSEHIYITIILKP